MLKTTALLQAALAVAVACLVGSKGGERFFLKDFAPPHEVCGNGTAAWSAIFKGLAPHDPAANVTRAYAPKGNKTLLVECDVSAWNNVRMSWETSVCFAYKTKRIYRVPAIAVGSYADVRLKFRVNKKLRQLNLFDYYDEESFRRVVPALLDTDSLPGENGTVFVADKSPHQKPMRSFSEHAHLVYKQDYEHLDTRVFAQYANAHALVPHETFIKLVQAAFRLRQDLICRAVARLMAFNLKPLGYLALHRRTGDFVPQKELYVDSATALKHVSPLVRDKTVLVLSDEHEPEFLQGLKAAGAARVVFWGDVKFKGFRDKVWSVQMDMLAAVAAKEFIASPFSTVSTGIVRWRVQAGTHQVGDAVQYTKEYHPGYEGWPSPGAKGTFL